MAAAVGALDEDFVRVVGENAYKSMTGHFGSMDALIHHASKQLGICADDSRVERAVGLWYDFHRKGYESPYPGALHLLQQIRDMGLKTGLVTNCGAEAPDLWQQSDFAGLMDAAVFSSMEDLLKPDPRIYLVACERLQVAPDKCLYVDDCVGPLAGAADTGMHTLLIRHPANTVGLRSLDKWIGPRVTSLSEVLPHITIARGRNPEPSHN